MKFEFLAGQISVRLSPELGAHIEFVARVVGQGERRYISGMERGGSTDHTTRREGTGRQGSQANEGLWRTDCGCRCPVRRVTMAISQFVRPLSERKREKHAVIAYMEVRWFAAKSCSSAEGVGNKLVDKAGKRVLDDVHGEPCGHDHQLIHSGPFWAKAPRAKRNGNTDCLPRGETISW